MQLRIIPDTVAFGKLDGTAEARGPRPAPHCRRRDGLAPGRGGRRLPRPGAGHRRRCGPRPGRAHRCRVRRRIRRASGPVPAALPLVEIPLPAVATAPGLVDAQHSNLGQPCRFMAPTQSRTRTSNTRSSATGLTDRRFDLRQVHAGLAVSVDGGVLVHAGVFGGGEPAVRQVVTAMRALSPPAGELWGSGQVIRVSDLQSSGPSGPGFVPLHACGRVPHFTGPLPRTCRRVPPTFSRWSMR